MIDYLDDLFDQFGNFTPPQPAAPMARPVIRPLNEEEQQTALQSLGSRVMGGLGYVGGTLDKTFGGRAVRGLLGGRPEELLSIIPGSDMMGLTDPNKAVSGLELMGRNPQTAGLTDHALGIGAEIALDPATYLTFGASAVNKLGAAAKKAGALPATMAGRIRGVAAGTPQAAALAAHMGVPEAEVAGKALGGLAGLRLPFQETAATIGTGPTAAKIADAGGALWDKAVYSAPGRTLSAMFDPTVNIAGRAPVSAAGQRAARGEYEAMKRAESGARGIVTKYGRQLDSLGMLDDNATLRGLLEGTFTGPVKPELGSIVGEMKQQLAGWKAEAETLGRSTDDLVDKYIEYFPRQRTALEPATAAGRKANRQGKIFDTSTPNQVRRLDELRDVPGGTEAINQIVTDPAARAFGHGGDADLAAQHIRHTYLGGDAAADAERAALVAAKPPQQVLNPQTGHLVDNPDWLRLQELNAQHAQSYKLSKVAEREPVERVTGQMGMFANSPVSDLSAYGLRHEKAQASTRAIHEMLANTVTDVAGAGADSKPLLEVLRRAGLKEGQAGGAQSYLLDKLLNSGKLPAGSTIADLAGFHVPGETVNDVIRYADGFNFPSILEPALHAWDSYTNLLKSHLAGSLLGPSFHSRNTLTGGFMNWIGGARDTRFGALDPESWYRPFADAIEARAGKTIPGANQIKGLGHLSDADATRILLDEMHAHAVRPGQSSLVNEIVSAADHASGDAGKLKLPGTPEEGLLDILKQGVPKTKAQANPLAIKGVGDYGEDVFAPVAAGRKVAHLVDDNNRISSYLAFRRQGFEPEMAAARAKGIHYDYTNLTPFERQVMRRAIPFYSWIRNNTPTMLGELMREPGGKLGASIRATSDARNVDAEGFLPPQVGEGLAIPLGSEDATGRRRFLTNLGLPFEDAFDLFSGGANPLQRSLQKAISMTNPLIKAPIEVAAGRQMHSGRQLEDLYARTGSSTLDQILMNSPASRLLTTVGTLTDPRKGPEGIAANLLGPGRITDVQMDRARNVAGRDAIEDLVRQNPNFRIFERMQLRPGMAQNLTPQELMLMRLYQTLETEARERARAAQANAFNVAVPR